jgi:hypothetical protein
MQSACISRQGFQGPGCWLLADGVWSTGVWCGRTGTGHRPQRWAGRTGYGLRERREVCEGRRVGGVQGGESSWGGTAAASGRDGDGWDRGLREKTTRGSSVKAEPNGDDRGRQKMKRTNCLGAGGKVHES